MRLAASLRRARHAALIALPLGLAACGGGGGDGGHSSIGDPLAEQKSWVASYLNDAYLWYASKPNPDPANYSSVDAFFHASLSTGSTAGVPKDRWSYTEATASHQQFFSAGQTMGYGVAVAGVEVAGQPNQPLRVRYIEPASPAFGKLQRGETLLTINGKPASSYISSGDFSVLSAVNVGDTLTLSVQGTSGTRQVTIAAAVYNLTPVSVATILSTPDGTPVGYVVLHDFITQALTPFDTAFAGFQMAGVDAVVLDMRYNGGGLVSVADDVASYMIGAGAVNQPFASLTYSDKKQASNTVFRFGSKAAALGLGKVYVLTGSRTCSASELVINGLKPFVTVVQIGDTTCGKPVGFNPVDHEGTTYSAVNFQSQNASGVGSYYDGIAPTCAVADDVDHALGDPAERLTAAALSYVDDKGCPAASSRDQPMALRERAATVIEPGQSRGMILR